MLKKHWSNAASQTILSTRFNVASTLLPFLATMLQLPLLATMSQRNFVLSTKSKQTEPAQFVTTLSKGQNLMKNLFDIGAKKQQKMARMIFYDKLVRHCCRFRQHSRTLLRHSCLLLRHCCWCDRDLVTTQHTKN